MATVQLTDEEQKDLERIEFDSASKPHDPAATRLSGESACHLMRSLLRRKAIPQIRLDYFINPDLNVSRTKASRKQIFENNGTTGDDIFRHPHFLKYLRYFLYGPDLPTSLAQVFHQTLADCHKVTSGDLPTLWDLARRLTRQHGLDRRVAAEEFYKLSLEAGLVEPDARSVRDTVMRMR